MFQLLAPLLMLSLTNCLKLSHLNDTASPPVVTKSSNGSLVGNASAQVGSQQMKPIKTIQKTDAEIRLMNFVNNDTELLKQMKPGNQLTDYKLKKLLEFMANDTYYQQKLIRELQQIPQSTWMKDMPKNSKIKYLQIVTKISQSQLNNTDKVDKITSQLIKDTQIRPYIDKNLPKQKQQNKTTTNATNNQSSSAYTIENMKRMVPQARKQVKQQARRYLGKLLRR